MMSFDEEPDGDIHGECSAEIHKQKSTIAAQAEEIKRLKEQVALQSGLRWRRHIAPAKTNKLCAKIGTQKMLHIIMRAMTV